MEPGSAGNLFHMIRFAELWRDQEQVGLLAQHLGWSHFKGTDAIVHACLASGLWKGRADVVLWASTRENLTASAMTPLTSA